MAARRRSLKCSLVARVARCVLLGFGRSPWSPGPHALYRLPVWLTRSVVCIRVISIPGKIASFRFPRVFLSILGAPWLQELEEDDDRSRIVSDARHGGKSLEDTRTIHTSLIAVRRSAPTLIPTSPTESPVHAIRCRHLPASIRHTVPVVPGIDGGDEWRRSGDVTTRRRWDDTTAARELGGNGRRAGLGAVHIRAVQGRCRQKGGGRWRPMPDIYNLA
ncbi:hypothetical protein C8F04DRAFT_1199332 [Mycena alexandri]|uniref:Uncharacterized protein n=1 Tax=Mycena alexandri TaxID=1745969 RepID=A0AAD6S024_9AGAR|nr:hypothetical protein C8F04DRAFT_1199332 [Mycena alexandri]